MSKLEQYLKEATENKYELFGDLYKKKFGKSYPELKTDDERKEYKKMQDNFIKTGKF